MRAIGYSFSAALADIIDNSLGASSKSIEVQIRKDPAFVSILDDGSGMSQMELVEAMRFGSTSPLESRNSSDHGRFGLGLKTASLSQCRQLTVVSKKDGQLSAARWDLSWIEETNSWSLLILSDDQIEEEPTISRLRDRASGTIVIWRGFDRFGVKHDTVAASNLLVQNVSEAISELSLIFHRFLSGASVQKVSIDVNGTALKPIDPYFLDNRFTRVVGREDAYVDGCRISATAYILPNINHLSSSELNSNGGAAGIRDLQGFFVYRNFRLISYGTWFKLAPRDTTNRLARIQVDVTNSIDAYWQLDVKKRTAVPSPAARHFLSSMVDLVTRESNRRFTPVVSATQKLFNQDLWLRKLAGDKVTFEINRSHPIVVTAMDDLSEDQRRSLNALLRSIEITLPVKQMQTDTSQFLTIEPDDSTITKTLTDTLAILTDGLHGGERQQLLRDVAFLEPFRSYPTITSALLGALDA